MCCVVRWIDTLVVALDLSLWTDAETSTTLFAIFTRVSATTTVKEIPGDIHTRASTLDRRISWALADTVSSRTEGFVGTFVVTFSTVVWVISRVQTELSTSCKLGATETFALSTELTRLTGFLADDLTIFPLSASAACLCTFCAEGGICDDTIAFV